MQRKSTAHLLEARFEFPDINHKRVLILGMGGGCDIYTAHTLGCDLSNKYKAAHISVASATNSRDLTGHRPVLLETPHILTIPPAQVPGASLVPRQSFLEQTIPHWPDGSPLVIIMPSGHPRVTERIRENCELLIPELQSMSYDFIVGVTMEGTL